MANDASARTAESNYNQAVASAFDEVWGSHRSERVGRPVVHLQQSALGSDETARAIEQVTEDAKYALDADRDTHNVLRQIKSELFRVEASDEGGE